MIMVSVKSVESLSFSSPSLSEVVLFSMLNG